MQELATKELVVAGQAGIHTPVYLGMIDFMKKKGYTVKKVTDWLEISPRSAYYQDMMSKKANIEQSVGRILPVISDLRRDIELIRHDLRKLESINKHIESNDLAVMKSDYVDLVDSHTPISMIGLANSGRFPTIVVDFYKINKKEDIEKLGVSTGEKQILKNKWKLFKEWKVRYGTEVKGKVEMLKEQLRSREGSLRSYKDSLKPYVKALYRIKVSEGSYAGLDDPMLIEGYQTSVAGVDLAMWKGVSLTKEHHYEDDDKFDYYAYFEVQVRRSTLIQRDKEGEGMRIFISVQLLNRDELSRKEKEIKQKEKDVERQLGELLGEVEVKKEEDEEMVTSSSGIASLLNYSKGISKANLDGFEKKILKEDLNQLEIKLKTMINGLTLEDEV